MPSWNTLFLTTKGVRVQMGEHGKGGASTFSFLLLFSRLLARKAGVQTGGQKEKGVWGK